MSAFTQKADITVTFSIPAIHTAKIQLPLHAQSSMMLLATANYSCAVIPCHGDQYRLDCASLASPSPQILVVG
jgi:hypothetical protein